MTADDSSQPFTLVYILGSGHCGSTLLTLLMNGHPHMFGLGEIVNLVGYGPWRPDNRKQRELEAPVWREAIECYERSTGQQFADLDMAVPRARDAWRWDSARARQWAAPGHELLACLARVSGAGFLVDSSKWPQRLRLLERAGTEPIKVVHLTRDGHGVVYSYRLRGATFRGSLRRWLDPIVASVPLRRRVGKANWLRVRYEDLAADPDATLRRICAFLGVAFDPAMLRWRENESFAIAGNAMRYRFDDEIRTDERWRSSMSRADRVRFAVFGGWLNRLTGY